MDTQLGDVTSLVPADRAGDPFTLTDSPDPPSLGVGPEDPALKLVGQPEIASLSHYAPVLAGPTPIADIRGHSAVPVRPPGLSVTISAPFSGRQGLTRAKLVQREGGTARSEKSVEDGIDWLVRHQRPDGSWSLNYLEQCQAGGSPTTRSWILTPPRPVWPSCHCWAPATSTPSRAGIRIPSGAASPG